MDPYNLTDEQIEALLKNDKKLCKMYEGMVNNPDKKSLLRQAIVAELDKLFKDEQFEDENEKSI